MYKWLELVEECMGKLGYQHRVAPTFKDLLISAGFVDVVETKFEVPWGPWPQNKRQMAIGIWHVGL